MSALLLDEHPPAPVPAQLSLLSTHGPLGSWPLECWISDCFRPRVEGGTLCAKHEPQTRAA